MGDDSRPYLLKHPEELNELISLKHLTVLEAVPGK